MTPIPGWGNRKWAGWRDEVDIDAENAFADDGGGGPFDKIEYSVPWGEVTGGSLVLGLILESPAVPFW